MPEPIALGLPEIYRSLLPDFFQQSIPEESLATCDHCAMAAPLRGGGTQPTTAYRPDRKCCTFHPAIPNYLVGAILDDPDPGLDEGRRRLRAVIARRVGITPYGIFPGKKYQLLMESGAGFGQSKALLCPFFNLKANNCSIWKHREAVCATYFCKTVSGQAGKSFWHALKMYLIYVQDCLTGYVLLDQGMPIKERTKYQHRPITARDLDDLPPDDSDYQKMWAHWAGSEEAFYTRAHHLVGALTREQLAALGGLPHEVLLDGLKRSHAAVHSVPDRLVPAPGRLTDCGSCVRVHLEAAEVSFDLPKSAIAYFDGKRATPEVLDLLSVRENVQLDDDLVHCLYHHRVLLAAGEQEGISESAQPVGIRV